jgi:hypothetical protein
MASKLSLIGHKMLCPNADKIMPVTANCQGFSCFFSMGFYNQKSITYGFFYKNYFKKTAKKVAFSQNPVATTSSGINSSHFARLKNSPATLFPQPISFFCRRKA